MSPKKVTIRFQQFTQLIQAADTFQNLSASQVNEQSTMEYLAVFQLFLLNPGNTVFASQDQAVGLLFFAHAKNIVHQIKKAFRPDGL